MPDSGRIDVHPPPLRNELTVQDMTGIGDEVWAVGWATSQRHGRADHASVIKVRVNA